MSEIEVELQSMVSTDVCAIQHSTDNTEGWQGRVQLSVDNSNTTTHSWAPTTHDKWLLLPLQLQLLPLQLPPPLQLPGMGSDIV